jgi:nucleotide-binding universal stress UspA family protein
MFKHLLLATDGSRRSESAIRKAIQFAKSAGAKVTGFYAIPQFRALTHRPEMLSDTREEYRKNSATDAAAYLEVIEKAARQAGVPCDTVSAISARPYRSIIEAAEEKGCDLIMMASRGNRGLKRLLSGSETQKVLTRSRIPVLVYR